MLAGAEGFEGSEAWVIFQEAPKMPPGGQISWYFESFWSPGDPGLHFEVQGSISSCKALFGFAEGFRIPPRRSNISQFLRKCVQEAMRGPWVI